MKALLLCVLGERNSITNKLKEDVPDVWFYYNLMGLHCRAMTDPALLSEHFKLGCLYFHLGSCSYQSSLLEVISCHHLDAQLLPSSAGPEWNRMAQKAPNLA